MPDSTPSTPPGDDDLAPLLAPFRTGADSLWAVPPDERLTAALDASVLTENDVRWVRNAADLIRALPSLLAAIDGVQIGRAHV